MSHGSCLNFFIDPALERAYSEHGRFRLMLGSSCVLHCLFIGLALSVSLSSRVEQLPGAYQVSLISFSELPDSPVVPNVEKQATSPPSLVSSPPPTQTKPQEHASPPLEPATKELRPVETSPPLVDSFIDALKDVVVPRPRAIEPIETNRVVPTLKTTKSETTSPSSITQTIIPPPKVSKTIPATSLPPRKPSKAIASETPRIQGSIAQTLQSVMVPEPKVMPAPSGISPKSMIKSTRNPKLKTEKPLTTLRTNAPQLTPIHPLNAPTSQKAIPREKHQLTESVTQSIKSVMIPQPQNRTSSQAHIELQSPQSDRLTSQPAEQPFHNSSSQESLTSGLKKAVQSIVIPPLRQKMSSNPALPPMTKPSTQSRKERPKTQIQSIPPLRQPPPLAKTLDQHSAPIAPQIESQKLQAELEQSRQDIARLSIPSLPTVEKPTTTPVQQENDVYQQTVTDLHMPGRASDGNPYWSRVKAMIVQNWIAPHVEVVRDGFIQAIVAFRIDRLGKISHIEIQQPSGNVYYDVAAKRAVMGANPLPPFPSDMRDAYHDLQFQFSVIKE